LQSNKRNHENPDELKSLAVSMKGSKPLIPVLIVTIIALLVIAMLVLMFVAPYNREGTQGKQNSDKEPLYPHLGILGFGTLIFGLNEEVSLKALPWGLKADDLPLTWKPKDADIWFRYGDKIPPTKWDSLRDYKFRNSDYLQFILGYTNNYLSFIRIVVPGTSTPEDVLQAIFKDVEARYGMRLKHVTDEGPEYWYMEKPPVMLHILATPGKPNSPIYLSLATNDGWYYYNRSVGFK
jgi:hypothetical protein